MVISKEFKERIIDAITSKKLRPTEVGTIDGDLYAFVELDNTVRTKFAFSEQERDYLDQHPFLVVWRHLAGDPDFSFFSTSEEALKSIDTAHRTR